MKWLLLGILWHRQATTLYWNNQKLKVVTWYRPWEQNPHPKTVENLMKLGWVGITHSGIKLPGIPLL